VAGQVKEIFEYTLHGTDLECLEWKTLMDIGLNYAFGTNSIHDVAFLKHLAQTMEALGFNSLWLPEHVVSFPSDSYSSKYPYSKDGAVPWQGDLSLHDPLLVTVAAAQSTSTLRFGSGIVILPQRPPLLTAKELMTLDHLTGGRFEFGIGGGWSAEEYAALGVPFANRGRRFDEYIEAIRCAWTEQPASFSGDFVSFRDVILAPKPLTPGGPRMLVGGSSPAAFSRAARLGDGWFGHWTQTADPAHELNLLADALSTNDRHGSDEFLIKASLVHSGEPEQLAERIQVLTALGVHELILVVPIRSRHLEQDLNLWAQAAGLG
jgi:probable F420-dependent oxidoreductase